MVDTTMQFLSEVDGQPTPIQVLMKDVGSGRYAFASFGVQGDGSGGSEVHIGQVGGHSPTIQATLNGVAPVIAAAGDYADNDVFSQNAGAGQGLPFVFPNAARVAGGTGTIVRLSINFSVAAIVATTRIHFFSAAPTTSEMDDNAAFALDLDDRTKYIGFVDLPAMQSMGEFSYAQNIGFRLQYDLEGTSLYAIGQWADAVTNEVAAMTCRLEIGVEQD